MLGACAPGAHPVARAPSGIVSLNPCTDAILAEVAAPGTIRALSAYSSDPSASSMDIALAHRFPATAGTVEEIAALRPALVIGGTYTGPATRTALARLGIPLVELPIARSVPESMAQVRRIAALAGNPAGGEVLVRRMAVALAAARPPAGPPLPAVVWQSGGIVAGDDTLIADLLRLTGFANHAAARGLGQADYLPLEQMLADPPVLIFAAGSSASGEDRLLRHPALAALTGTVRTPLPGALLWCGGPTVIRAAGYLAAARRRVPPRPLAAGIGGRPFPVTAPGAHP